MYRVGARPPESLYGMENEMAGHLDRRGQRMILLMLAVAVGIVVLAMLGVIKPPPAR